MRITKTYTKVRVGKHLITHYTKQTPTWEANRFSTCHIQTSLSFHARALYV